MRWLCFIIVILTTCGLTCYFYNRDQTEDIACLLFIAALTAFFYVGDAHVDEVISTSVERNELEE